MAVTKEVFVNSIRYYVALLVLMVTVFLWRGQLLAVEYGTSVPFVALAVTLLICAVVIQAKRRKHLTKAILTGIPELSTGNEPGKLLTEGIYGKVRHPRYIELWLFVVAYTLFSNYLALYVGALLTVPTLYLVVVLEERELRQRFGIEYEEYCSQVPRFFTRRKARK